MTYNIHHEFLPWSFILLAEYVVKIKISCWLCNFLAIWLLKCAFMNRAFKCTYYMLIISLFCSVIKRNFTSFNSYKEVTEPDCSLQWYSSRFSLSIQCTFIIAVILINISCIVINSLNIKWGSCILTRENLCTG